MGKKSYSEMTPPERCESGPVGAEDLLKELRFLAGMAKAIGETALGEDISFIADRFSLEKRYQVWAAQQSLSQGEQSED